jgi:hypothetical protein
MQTSIRFTTKDGKTDLEIIDLKYKNRVVATIKLTQDTVRWLIKELAKEL